MKLSPVKAALAAGMNAHVSKPIDMEQLAAVLIKELTAAENAASI